ncbi:MAG: 4Fe-4S ferredoxin [Candidatus Nanoarchaeia archaeon]|nr:4Fe-4S ferredoxin [Candidatus Nanoarchaeia archaeon]
MPKPIINYDKLGKHDEIIDICPTGVFAKEKGKIIVKNPEECIGCRACEANAPEGAVRVVDD